MPIECSHYALIQDGYCIYGVGETPDEARDDAAQWLEDEEDQTAQELADSVPVMESLIGPARDGSLVIVPCTQALYERVRAVGTVTYAEMPDNSGLCLPTELEE